MKIWFAGELFEALNLQLESDMDVDQSKQYLLFHFLISIDGWWYYIGWIGREKMLILLFLDRGDCNY